jgi:acyl-CoA dehydrogenase
MGDNMQIELSEEQKAIKKQSREFLEREIQPYVESYEKERRLIPHEFMKKLTALGYIGGLLPKNIGGKGFDLLTYLLMIEELSRVWPSLRIMVAGTNLILTYVYKYGTPEQQAKFVQPVFSGEKLGFFALSEPEVGSDAGNIKMTAVLGGGKWILNGTKSYVACGVDGNLGIVFASTDPLKKGKGITAFLIEKGVSQYETRQVFKMGTHCCSLAELNFRNTAVPQENVIGKIGEGFNLAMSFLNVVRAAVPFVCLGVAQACIDNSIKFAKERIQFGKPIGAFQLIQEKIANMVMLTEAMRLLGFQAAYRVDKGLPCRKEISIAKLFASEAVLKIAEDAMQIHGQYGYVQDYPIERYYRDIRYFTVADGTSEMHRLILGREILDISAFA